MLDILSKHPQIQLYRMKYLFKMAFPRAVIHIVSLIIITFIGIQHSTNWRLSNRYLVTRSEDAVQSTVIPWNINKWKHNFHNIGDEEEFWEFMET